MEIKSILQKHNFRFKKSLGQNFISDTGLLKAIARDSGIDKDTLVIEVGAGAGTLTRVLAEDAGEVLAFEVDEALAPILAESLIGLDNVKVYFKDILDMSDEDVAQLTGGKKLRVVANLPYYITTPLIMRFIESSLPVVSLTVMVQKEVADRLTAQADTAEYGAVTLAVRLRGDAKIVRKVSRNMFYPAPQVDSAIINIDINKELDVSPKGKMLKKLIKSGFAMRRKTLANNITAAFALSKTRAAEVIAEAGFAPSIRGEALELKDYQKLADILSKQ